MVMKHLVTLARRSQIRLCLNQAIRLASSAIAAVYPSATPATSSSSPPHVMPYDQASEIVKSKLKKLENPDSRFLKYASPHPKLSSHDLILSAPEVRVTTLPNGLRVATESNLSAKTATVGVWIDAGSRFESDSTNDDLAYAIMYEVTKLAYRVSLDDVTRAWHQLKSSLLLNLDGTTPVAKDIGRQVKLLSFLRGSTLLMPARRNMLPTNTSMTGTWLSQPLVQSKNYQTTTGSDAQPTGTATEHPFLPLFFFSHTLFSSSLFYF